MLSYCTPSVESRYTSGGECPPLNFFINKINAVLEGLDFVRNDDKMYTDNASQIHYYNVNKKYNTKYGTKTYTSQSQK